MHKLAPGYLQKKKYSHGLVAALGALSLCLIISLFYWDPNETLSSFIPASAEMVFVKGEYWRLLTSVFAHADLDHLLSNSLMLVFLTYFVDSFYGLVTTVSAFLLGALVNLVSLQWIGGDTVLVGASGVVYLLWGFWLSLYLLIQKNLSLINRILRVGAVFLILLIPTVYSPRTSYFAHYFGFVLGCAWGLGAYYFGPKRPSKLDIKLALEKQNPPPAPAASWESEIDWNEEQSSVEQEQSSSPLRSE